MFYEPMEAQEKISIQIGIDIRTIHQGGGCATYLYNLIPEVCARLPNSTFHVFTNHNISTVPEWQHIPNIRFHRIPVPKFALLVYDWLLLPIAARRVRARLFHGPKSATSPLYRVFGIRTITTIHDIIPLTRPETEKRLNHLYWFLQIPLAYRVSDVVITISQYARQQMESRFGERNHLFVVYHGVDHVRDNQLNISQQWPQVQEQYSLGKPYILYIGSIQPRKRVLELICAYWDDAQLRAQYDLVIAGQQGWLSAPVNQFVKDHHAEGSVRIVGSVNNDVRSVLYAHASVFAYLSIDEGFGFPILEAMAAGTPVITSNVSCLPEIASDAALCIAADQQSAIQRALHDVLDHPERANSLVERGKKRAAQFTWAHCAQETIAAYIAVLQR